MAITKEKFLESTEKASGSIAESGKKEWVTCLVVFSAVNVI